MNVLLLGMFMILTFFAIYLVFFKVTFYFLSVFFQILFFFFTNNLLYELEHSSLWGYFYLFIHHSICCHCINSDICYVVKCINLSSMFFFLLCILSINVCTLYCYIVRIETQGSVSRHLRSWNQISLTLYLLLMLLSYDLI